MATLYTDESRIARYDICRKKAKRCEKAFDFSMWAMLLIAVTEILPQLARGFLYGVFIGELGPFFVMLAVIAIIVFGVYAVFRRDSRFLLGALLVSGFAGYPFYILFGYLTPIVLLPALIASAGWRRLSEEEGFPEFIITFAEQSSQQTKQVSRAHHRAVEAGTRTEQAELDAHADMRDLLDEGAEQLPAELKNYHNRSLGSDAVVQLQQPHDDRMDDIEDL